MRLIDADALKEKICTNVYPVQDAFNSCDYGMFWTGGIEKAIDAAPTIEPKKGKWEDVEADEGEWICFKCSVCGHDAYSYAGEILSNEWKFCPYCGARMVSDDEA